MKLKEIAINFQWITQKAYKHCFSLFKYDSFSEQFSSDRSKDMEFQSFHYQVSIDSLEDKCIRLEKSLTEELFQSYISGINKKQRFSILSEKTVAIKIIIIIKKPLSDL